MQQAPVARRLIALTHPSGLICCHKPWIMACPAPNSGGLTNGYIAFSSPCGTRIVVAKKRIDVYATSYRHGIKDSIKSSKTEVSFLSKSRFTRSDWKQLELFDRPNMRNFVVDTLQNFSVVIRTYIPVWIISVWRRKDRDVFVFSLEFQSGCERISRVSVVLLISVDPAGLNSTCFTHVPQDAGPPDRIWFWFLRFMHRVAWARIPAVRRARRPRRFREVETSGRISRGKGGFRALRGLSTNNVHRRCSSPEPARPLGIEAIPRLVIACYRSFSCILFIFPALSFASSPCSSFYV